MPSLLLAKWPKSIPLVTVAQTKADVSPRNYGAGVVTIVTGTQALLFSPFIRSLRNWRCIQVRSQTMGDGRCQTWWDQINEITIKKGPLKKKKNHIDNCLSEFVLLKFVSASFDKRAREITRNWMKWRTRTWTQGGGKVVRAKRGGLTRFPPEVSAFPSKTLANCRYHSLMDLQSGRSDSSLRTRTRSVKCFEPIYFMCTVTCSAQVYSCLCGRCTDQLFPTALR